MELIREKLLYKNIIKICMKDLKPREQYECIRLIFTTNPENISICLHDNINKNVLDIITNLKISIIECENH